MNPIPNAYEKVPMMFRAQIEGRCQLQRLDPNKKKAGEQQDVEFWAQQWVDKAEFLPSEQRSEIKTVTRQTKTYQISWRFVTNGGQDDGMIRPVIGAYGIPFYPGSSMKGVFRQACQRAEKAGKLKYGTCNDYCGDEIDVHPGILRFEGAYPINDWTENLVDLVHPQQQWQVKTYETSDKKKLKGESAFALISLDRPVLKFSISSIKPLAPEQWEEIWKIWEDAIAIGLGTRVYAGYGQTAATSENVLYRVTVKGQGQAAKLIDGTGEFRPNIFRASLRCHALRIFGGLTGETTAERLVEQLFGGVNGKGTVGLLSLGFNATALELETFGKEGYEQPTYKVEGDIIWSLTQDLPEKQQVALKKLVADLMCFAMVLGGFGKSWRRADHRLFYSENEDYEKLIGCHWQWAGTLDKANLKRVANLKQIGKFIDSVRETAKAWMQLQAVTPSDDRYADWREAWHPDRVQVWGRIAETRDESEAINWLHKPYRKAAFKGEVDKTIKGTSVTGKLSQVGCLWHRMYPPKFRLVKKEGKLVLLKTNRFLELLTIFPDDSPASNEFLKYLETKPHGFELIWGKP